MNFSRTLLSVFQAAPVFLFAFAGAAPLANAATNLPYDQATAGAITSPAQTNEYTFSSNAGDVLNITVVTKKSTSTVTA